MQLDFRILLVIFILIFFLIYILSYFSVITILIAICLSILLPIIFGWSTGERCATKLKLPAKANSEVSLSRKGKKKSLSPHSRSRSTYHKYTHNISSDENMHRNGFSNSSFNDKKFDRSFDKWRSPVNSPGMRSPAIRVASPVAGFGLRTRKPSQLVARRHSFSVKASLDTSTSESNSRIPFLPTIKRALGLETIVSPRYTSKDDYSNYTSYPEAASPGFVPAVRLSQHDRHPLSKVRSSAVRSPNTIKIAPPDPHKLGSPRMLEKRRKDPGTDDTRKTPDMQSVLTALKEKRRKRTAGPSEDTYCTEVPTQKSKRRRQESQQSNASTSSLPPLPASLPDLSVSDYTIPRLETPSLKRAAAPEVSEWEGHASNAKRLRQEGRYNSISSSLSSSRYLERSNRSYSPRPDWSQESTAELKRAIQREINKITQEMPSDLVTSLRLQCEGVQKDHSGKENRDFPVSTTAQDPASSLSSIQRADTVMLKPSLDKEDQSFDVSTSDTSLLDQSQNKAMTPRQKVTLNKSFSVRKRQMSLYTGLNKSFSKVPKSNVVACIEDYEADREAEQRRVEQMLEDIVSNEDADKNKVKGSVLGVTNTAVSTVVISSTPSTSNTAPVTSSVNLPNLSVNPLVVSKSITTSASTPAPGKVSTTQGLGSVTAPSFNISTSASTSASSLLASSPVSLSGSGTYTTVSAAPAAMSLGIQNTTTSVASTSSNNFFAGLPSSITPSLPGTNVASVSSSKVSQSLAGSFSVGNVAASVKATINTSSDINSTLSTKFGLQAADPGTVGAAIASAVAAEYSSKAPDVLNFGAATPSTNAGVIPNFGRVTNAAAAAVQPSFGVVNSVSTTAGPPSFGGISGVVTSNVAPKVTATGNTASTTAFSNASTVNTTGFPFGVATNVTQTGRSAPAPVFGNTTQSVPTASFGTSAGPNPNFGANNFQNTTATTFGTGVPTNQPNFTPVFATPNPTTQANTFGAPSGNAPTFGSAAPTFVAPQNKPTFGNTAPQVTKAATTGGFNFGGGAAPTVNSNIFGGAVNTAVSTSGFPAAPQTTAPPAFNFGTTNQTTTSASAFNFGNTSTQTTSSSSFNFGASNLTTTAASTTFSFGGATNPKPQAIDFRGVTNENKTQAATPAFNFGASNPTTTASNFGFGATVSKASTFNFGASATTNTVGAAPAFGGAKPQTSATPVFGGSTAQSSGTFQGGMTKSGSAPAFGDTGPSFSGGPKPSNPFNTSSSTMFGGNAPPGAPQAANSGNAVFGFGATTQQPQQPQQPSGSTTGFNFSAAAGGGGASTFNFGANASSTSSFGAGSPAPGFGQAPSTPGQGMFTVGASSSATKQRTLTKAKRRGTRR
ncbi:mucin-5AC-like isoform X2 [Mizuhopecten yessoensis]|uniref:Uncharacterized protein n=1 Tax=Mizuhopecten yessoensis TaxID=6573 RepID=A0A210PG24_MIZYE|nr:mucin-5AC-like isoform X2 [Mizuhopecten yessoensis]OWF35444.1 hypothetical protein KP79_PYT21519 [Mizuhopecten yessoensis]